MDFLENQSRTPGLAKEKKLRHKPYRVENRFSVPIRDHSEHCILIMPLKKVMVSVFLSLRLEKFCKFARPVINSECSTKYDSSYRVRIKCLWLQADRLEDRIRCPTYENGFVSRFLFPTTLFLYCLKVFGRAKLKTSQGVSNGQVCSVRVVRPIYV